MTAQKTSHDSETPANKQQVITACAFIHQSFEGVEKLFLPKRAETKKFLPGKYELPGGHIDFGENIIKGLKREILEEFNVEIKVGDPFYVFDYLNLIKGSHSIEIVYFASFIDPIEQIKLHPDDHSEYNWFSLTEVSENIEDKNDKEYAAIQKGFKLLQHDKLNLA